MKRRLKHKLKKYDIRHATLEIEFEECSLKEYTCPAVLSEPENEKDVGK
ncbi:MAG: hypothetical protein JW705_06920 [Methanosarcinaceae archaeon]|nr:hypothetical protein [Methanosarcinaceae archaeon]